MNVWRVLFHCWLELMFLFFNGGQLGDISTIWNIKHICLYPVYYFYLYYQGIFNVLWLDKGKRSQRLLMSGIAYFFLLEAALLLSLVCKHVNLIEYPLIWLQFNIPLPRKFKSKIFGVRSSPLWIFHTKKFIYLIYI